ncbi:MAG: hypothetical protein ACRERC_11260, partial [Candidatus Binatia bacterium]
MRASDPPDDSAKTAPAAPAPALASELALRDGELAALREALAVERAHAQAARHAVEAHLREAGEAAETRQRLETALGAQRDERAQLLVELRAEHATALQRLAGERDDALGAAAEAQTILSAVEYRIAQLESEAAQRGAELAALGERAALVEPLEAALEERAAE